MSAKRLGSFLTNITGTASQILRVKADESGCEFATPATIPTYTVTNPVTDRVINVADTSLDELAGVVGTLIADLTTLGAPGATQQVFESQEYTHSNSDSATIYTLVHNFGKCPDKVICYYKDGDYWSEIDDVYVAFSHNYGYSVQNATTNINETKVRVFNANVLGGSVTIKFKVFILGQVASFAFTWSSSEQVYPFEKNINGDTLYCKQMESLTLPNNGYASVAHGISNLATNKVFRIEAHKYYHDGYSDANMQTIESPFFYIYVDSTVFGFRSFDDERAFYGIGRMIYAK